MRGKDCVKTEAEIGVTEPRKPRNAGSHQKLEEAKMDSSLKFSEDT